MNAENLIADKALREVTACIGCNDCMIACPLPQSRNMSIAALNAAVHAAKIDDLDVVDFVTACTQCRQCVPACPADLSRADMVLFNKTKVENAVRDHALPLQVGQRVVASAWMLDELARQLSTIELLAGVAVEDIRRMLLTVTLRELQQFEKLYSGGEFHERLVIVLLGTLEQYSEDTPGEHVSIVTYGAGAFLGEMGVMADQPEPFSVAAVRPSVVVEIPSASVHRLMRHSRTFGDRMQELYRRRALWTLAHSPRALGGVPEEVVFALFEGAALVTLRAGQFAFREGEVPDGIFLVKCGFLNASTLQAGGQRRVHTYFREGDLFGLTALVNQEAEHGYSVEATTRTEMVRVSNAHFQAILRRFPKALGQLRDAALAAESVVRSPVLSTVQPQQMANPRTHAMPLTPEVLVDLGIAKGRQLLVVDQTKCTYCQGCVEACGRRHGNSRLQLRGPQLEHLLFPTACRHCEDPKCLLCSVNGIVRRPTGEISIIEDNCIGCGSCAERCPYDNITMYPVEQQPRGFARGLLDWLKGSPDRQAQESNVEPTHGPLRATKCDLCADFTDYACVTACPTGAAFRTDPELSFQELSAALDSRTGR